MTLKAQKLIAAAKKYFAIRKSNASMDKINAALKEFEDIGKTMTLTEKIAAMECIRHYDINPTTA